MSWVTIIWSMAASACLTLALLHFGVWFKDRKALASLAFTLAALSVACVAAGELVMMRARTPEEFGAALQWTNVPIFMLAVGLVGFVQCSFQTGRVWLGVTGLGLRLLSLILNFTTGPNDTYREIISLRQFKFLGDPVSVVAAGVHNPWVHVNEISSLILLAFLVDASVKLWHTGGSADRRRALVIGGSILVFIVTAGGVAALVDNQMIQIPYLISLPFLGIILVMNFELSRDVIHAAQMANALREGELRLTLAAEAAKLGVWSRDLVRNEIWASDHWRALFGFTKSEPINLDLIMQRLHPDDRETVRRTFEQASVSDGHYEMEYRVLLPGGQIRWIGSHGRVEFNGGRQPVLVRGASLDITRRREAETASRESEARFRIMADTAPALIWMSGPDKLCTYFNKGWLEFTGRTLEQEAGNGWTEGVHPEDLPECLKQYVKSFDARLPFTMEYRLRRHDGEYRWLSDTGVPRYDATRNFLGYIGSCMDLTERKRAEQETRLQREELAHLSRVTMLGELSGSLAHELNQPLGAILRNAEAAELFLQEPVPDLEELRAILADIRKDDQRAGAVIQRMRSLIKRREMERQRFDPNLLATDVISLVRSDAEARKVRLLFKPDSALPAVRGDRVQLQQVMLNLLLNAMDAVNDSAPEKRRVIVHLQTAGRNVEVAVSDTGHGLPADRLARVFEPFFTTKPNGMGMGLPISRTIVEAHGGHIQAENNPAGGATFRFTLPVSDEVPTAGENL